MTHSQQPPPRRTAASRLPLIGREAETARLLDLLGQPEVALVTLTGPGGVGKTRIALHAAALAAPAFPDGVVVADLAPVRDPALVLPTVARALGVRAAGEEPLVATLATALRGKRTLLVLDNMEQVAAAAPALASLLDAAPDVKALATSRILLRVYGERSVPVAPLPVPPEAADDPGGRAALAAPAVRLFLERALAVAPALDRSPEGLAAVAAICRRLEGLPLAIELAAARANALPPRQMLARLERPLPLLADGPNDRPERQRSMDGAVGWSYDLLGAPLRTLFRRLAVFEGGFTLDAAEAVVAGVGDEAGAVLGGVAGLVDASLLARDDQPDGTTRFTMLETIHAYALARLVADGEEAAVRAAHARAMLALARQALAHLPTPEQVAWLDRLEQDHLNLRAALAWSVEHDPVVAVTLAGDLWRYWDVRGDPAEGRDWLGKVLALPVDDGQHAVVLANAATKYGNLLFDTGALDEAADWYGRGLALWRQVGDERASADPINNLGLVALARGDLAEAHRLQSENLALRRRLGGDHWIGLAVNNLADVELALGRFAEAEALHHEALRRYTDAGDRIGVGFAHFNLGEVARHQGRLDEAEARYLAGTDLFEELGNRRGIAYCQTSLGILAHRRHDLRAARSLLTAALISRRELTDPLGVAECLTLLGEVAVERDAARGARILAAAAAHRARLHHAVHPLDLPALDAAVAKARATLGEARFAEAWQVGERTPASLVVEEAVAAWGGLAGDPRPAAGRPAVAPDSSPSVSAPDGVPAEDADRPVLTRRERDVLRLLAEGRSDREIADTLVIGVRTVETHAASIYRKLGVQGRSEATTAALRFRLV